MFSGFFRLLSRFCDFPSFSQNCNHNNYGSYDSSSNVNLSVGISRQEITSVFLWAYTALHSRRVGKSTVYREVSGKVTQDEWARLKTLGILEARKLMIRVTDSFGEGLWFHWVSTRSFECQRIKLLHKGPVVTGGRAPLWDSFPGNQNQQRNSKWVISCSED